MTKKIKYQKLLHQLPYEDRQQLQEQLVTPIILPKEVPLASQPFAGGSPLNEYGLGYLADHLYKT